MNATMNLIENVSSVPNLMFPDGDLTLEIGAHSYPFHMELPRNLPSSFEHKLGFIRYTVRGKIDRPWKFDHETKAAFTIVSPLDLNLHQTAKDPVKVLTNKYFGFCCCCKTGPLTIVMCLPVSGYVPGQQMPITLEVDNASEQKIANLVLTLRKVMDFHARYPYRESKHDKITISEARLGVVEKSMSKTFTHQVTIPALPPSNPGNCKIIDLSYELKVEGKIASCCHTNVDLKTPVYIGTIPLANYQRPIPATDLGVGGGDMPASFWPTAPAAPQENNVIGFESDPPPPYPGARGDPSPMYNSLYPDLPPPSFAQAMSGGQNILDPDDSEHMQGNMEFIPRYPMYNFTPSAPPPPPM